MPSEHGKEIEVYLYPYSTPVPEQGGWSVPHAWPLYSWKRDLVPIVQEAGWASELVWMGLDNLAPSGVRTPDCPAQSELLYQLHYQAAA
jgi:hypothetical protein